MLTRIADTFTASLARLTAAEQKAVKTTAFDLQLKPAAYGHRLHRIDGARDPNFWSARVNDDLRIVLHRTEGSCLLLYVDHHDKAYAWAERRRLERHPTTGAMQLVEIRERVVELDTPRPARAPAPGTGPVRPFARLSGEELAGYGVPADWIATVQGVGDEDEMLEVLRHLPPEAQEALLALAVGEKPRPAPAPVADPFAHPDAQRRFRLMGSLDELRRALDQPWEQWAVFLHPDQRSLVERSYRGPVRVGGSAGTAKTVVALHRVATLAATHPDARVLLATFSDPLAASLEAKLGCLLTRDVLTGGRVVVGSLATIARRLYTERFGVPRLADDAAVSALVEAAARDEPASRFPLRFLLAEWREVVDAWQIPSWEAYRTVPRLGRKTRLNERQREAVWRILARVREELRARDLVTWSGALGRLTEVLGRNEARPFDHVVVDECQDLGVAEARLVAALAGSGPDRLFLTGDLGQRIFQQPFSWKAVGIDLRGRSFTLRVNYRTSHQIRECADRLLPPEVADVDGLVEQRRGTVSLFDGPAPEIRRFETARAEVEGVAAWLRRARATDSGAVFVRSERELPRAIEAVKTAGYTPWILGEAAVLSGESIAVGTMHQAKGLEFRTVVVMACDESVLPSDERIAAIGDDADLQEVYDTERHLLYVACTRARDNLLVSGVEPVSEFLADLA